MRTETPVIHNLPIARKRAHAGFCRDTWEQYAKRPEVSRSALDRIMTSPMHMKHYLEVGSEDTPSLLFGRMFHTIVEARATGNDKLLANIAVWTNGDRRGKAWDEFKLQHAGRDIVKKDEFDKAQLMSDSLFRDGRARDYLTGATFEATALWTDEKTGLGCKARIDVVQSELLFEIKSAADVTREGFSNSAFNFGYDRQAAWYLEGAMRATGRPYLGFGFIVVEKEAPHAVNVHWFDDLAIPRAAAENRLNLDLYAACRADNFWPGPAGGVMATPKWRA